MIATKQVLVDFRAALLADATVLGLVGSRCYPTLAQQRADRPYIVYNLITNTPSLSHDGDANQTRMTLQIDVYGDTVDSVMDVSDAVKNRLEGFQATQGSTAIQAMLLEDEESGYEEETELIRKRQDYIAIMATA